MKPLVRSQFADSDNEFVNKYKEENPSEELWINELYLVNVRRNLPCGWNDDNGKPILMTHLSIKNKDRSAKVDWRNFQYIKNQLVGEENEGVELFPAESRLVDGANQFHIFCFQNPELKFPFGFFDGRIVTEKRFLNETQRPFPHNRKPKDLKECEQKVEQIIKNELNKNEHQFVENKKQEHECECNDCGWKGSKADLTYDADDVEIDVCPECGSENIYEF